MTNLLLILVLANQSKQALPGKPFGLSAESYLFIATEAGVYRYDKRALEWSVITTKNGLPRDRATLIGVNEGLLWVGTDSGIGLADLKLLNFRVAEPVPISGICFDDDYVYAGSPAGILRYDKYKDRWERFETKGGVHDLTRTEEQLFAATDSGLAIFNTRYEKFEALPFKIEEALSHIIVANQNLFFIGTAHIFQYKKTTRGWGRFEGFVINDYAVRGDSVWAATDDGILIYDDLLGSWSRYRQDEWLPDKRITCISVTGDFLIFGSDQGISIVDNDKKTWKRYSLTNGLVEEKIVRAFEEGGQVYLLSPGWLQWLDDKGNWKRQKIEGAAARRPRFFTVDEAGGHLNLSPGAQVTLQGRATGQYEKQDTLDLTSETVDSRLMIGKTGGRMLAGYYDDTEKERKLYGVTYQDPGGFLSRASAGKLRSEFYKSNLIPPASYLGGNARFETNFAALNLAGGKRRSSFAAEYFTGNTSYRLVNLRDVDYLKNVFFMVDTVNPRIAAQSESLFIDNRQSVDNNQNTRLGYRIGGLVGDFDYKYRGVDYIIDYNQGTIRLLTAINDSAIVAIRYNGHEERVLQGRGQDSLEIKNRYLLGSSNIMPRSLMVRIFDTTNAEHPLHEFGLDNNRDGLVDDQFVNYFNGILHFPDRRPFPDTVYQADPTSCYNIMVSSQSKVGSYMLSHTPVVTNSEEVVLDGITLRRSIDYIIDYSTGNVVFLEKGKVLTRSEIEVRYEYEEESNDTTAAGQLVVTPGRGFEFVPGVYKSGPREVANLTSEWETRSNAFSLRLQPEVGANIDEGRAAGGRISLASSMRRLRVSAHYEDYDPSFQTFGRRISQYGELVSRYYAYSKYEFSDHAAVDGSFDRRTAEDTVESRAFQRQAGTGGVQLTFPRWPVFTFSGARRDYSGDDPQPAQKRFSGYSSFDYTVPEDLSGKILVKNLKLGGSYYAEKIEEAAETDRWAQNRIASLSSTLPLSNDIGIYYRNIDERQVGLATPLEVSENLKLTSRHDFVPGVFIANTYEIDDGQVLAQADRQLNLDHSLISYAKVGPGSWFADLCFINVDFTYGRTVTASVSGAEAARPFFSLSVPTGFDVYYRSVSNNYTFGADLRPGTSLIISPMYTLARGEAGYWDGLTRFREHNLTPKLEAYFGPNSIMTFQYFYKDETKIGMSKRVANNPVAEWQRRWSGLFRTKVRLSVRREVYTQQRIEETDEDVSPSVQFGYYNDRFFKEFELLTTLGFAYSRATDGLSSEIVSLAPLVELNMKPTSFFVIRTSFQPAYTYDLDDHDLSKFDPYLKLKGTLQF